MTIVAIPYRPDNGHRDRLFAHLQDHYWHHIGLPVIIGRDGSREFDHREFNRSRSINKALECDWDLAVVADADTWVPARQLHQALATARRTGRLVAAFDSVVELSRQCTTDILGGMVSLAGSFGADRVRTRDIETQSSMIVIPRQLWDAMGGFDERFVGWGGEDNAAWKAAALHGGEPQRIAGNAYHLWHPAVAGKYGGIQYKRNLNLWRSYDAATSIEELP